MEQETQGKTLLFPTKFLPPTSAKRVLITHFLGSSDLEGINLKNGNFREAMLGPLNLKKANLQEAQFQKAFLVRIDLGKAELGNADFGGANLHSRKTQRRSSGRS